MKIKKMSIINLINNKRTFLAKKCRRKAIDFYFLEILAFPCLLIIYIYCLNIKIV